MNSEELEVSLRTEFEHYLSGVRAEMKQKLADFQQKVEGEFEKHKSQIDEAIHDFSKHVESESSIDEVLKESVVEHLRLARDDGAAPRRFSLGRGGKIRLGLAVRRRRF